MDVIAAVGFVYALRSGHWCQNKSENETGLALRLSFNKLEATQATSIYFRAESYVY